MGCNPTTHLHCSKSYANELSDCSRTVEKIYQCILSQRLLTRQNNDDIFIWGMPKNRSSPQVEIEEVMKLKQRILSVALALCLVLSSQSAAYAWDTPAQEADYMEESTFGLDAREDTSLTPTGVYGAMIALKDQEAYKEGTPWTNDEPYSDSKGYYHWNGGTIDGKNISAVGCVAFAFILSDAAFGSLPNRMYEAGGFSYEDRVVSESR